MFCCFWLLLTLVFVPIPTRHQRWTAVGQARFTIGDHAVKVWKSACESIMNGRQEVRVLQISFGDVH